MAMGHRTLKKVPQRLTQRLMEPQQPIYTARPIFKPLLAGTSVPVWGRGEGCWDGHEDELVLELPRVSRAKKHKPLILCFLTFPIGLMILWKPMLALGVAPIIPATEISAKAWSAIHSIFQMLDGSPKNGIGRYGNIEPSRLVARQSYMSKVNCHRTRGS